MLVSEFCGVAPKIPFSVTLSSDTLENPQDTAHVCLSLIKATCILQQHDIYHLDIKFGNIVVQMEDNTITPYLIDYGLALNGIGRTHATSVYPIRSKVSKQTPPELYRSNKPLPTSDLYSVANVIRVIAKNRFGGSPLEEKMEEYRALKPNVRPGHDEFYDMVHDCFLEIFKE